MRVEHDVVGVRGRLPNSGNQETLQCGFGFPLGFSPFTFTLYNKCFLGLGDDTLIPSISSPISINHADDSALTMIDSPRSFVSSYRVTIRQTLQIYL